jgi:folate-dependent phosphoribosylglycinamide formyltransferase PurN
MKGVVVLIGNSILNKEFALKFLNSDIPVLKVIVADNKTNGINFSYLKIALRKHGLLKVTGQILERVFYKAFNRKKDAKILNGLLNKESVKKDFLKFSDKILNVKDYNDKVVVETINNLYPDFIVIQTPYWVGKKVRSIPTVGILGGHPGITPHYRGVHSPFWAAYHKDFRKIGYSTFWVDSGVDTGDVITQGKIPYEANDSYITVSWKGMQLVSNSILKSVEDFYNGIPIPREPHERIDESTNFTHPTIFQYVKYRFIQRILR